MYDTVEIPLMPGAGFCERISSIKTEVEFSEPLKSAIPFRSNLYYKQVVDLRRVAEIDAILHLNAKKTGTHKIQIVEAGRKCQGEIADTISEIVQEHPDLLGVSRVDSCADVVDGPSVKWVAQSVRARCAQWQAEFGTVDLRDEGGRSMDWSEMGKREVQTMYLGKRPNCFRVYDKLAERQNAWGTEKRRHEKNAAEIVVQKATQAITRQDLQMWRLPQSQWGPEERTAFLKQNSKLASDAVTLRAEKRRRELICSGRFYLPFPDFATWFAAQCVGPMTNVVQMRLPGQEEPEQLGLELVPQLPKVLTRVERQMAAGRVPPAIDTFEKLFSPAALEFNPFDRLNFSPSRGTTQIDMDDYSPVEFAAGMMFKEWLEEGMSYQQLFAYWDRKRNAKRIAEKFAPFVAAANPPKVVSVTSSELYERYRSSVSRQMAA